MSIDESGDYWVGTEAADIDAYLRAYTADDYPVDKVVQARCACGQWSFRLLADSDEGCAQRICASCAAEHLICDSGEYWDDAEPEEVTCPCGKDAYEVAVGFSHRDDGSVKWITVGNRCLACGVLGAVADWKIDYDPTGHLYGLV